MAARPTRQPKEATMKYWLAVLACLVMTTPALAQDKAKADDKKAAPAASAPKADEKKQPTAKQKAQQDRMRACSKEASDKKLKGDERKKFMSTCMKG
jgi:hypothetical protein